MELATFFPGAVYFISRWFKRNELSHLLSTAAFGALMVSAILDVFDGLFGYTAWCWLFLIEELSDHRRWHCCALHSSDFLESNSSVGLVLPNMHCRSEEWGQYWRLHERWRCHASHLDRLESLAHGYDTVLRECAYLIHVIFQVPHAHSVNLNELRPSIALLLCAPTCGAFGTVGIRIKQKNVACTLR